MSVKSIACSPQRSNPFTPVLIILILIALAVGATGVILNSHAEQHIESDDIRNCLSKNGPSMTYKHAHDPIWYLVCQINDTRWGIQAVTKDGFEKSAFSPGDASLRAVREYLARFAVRWKGPLPWLPQ